MSKWSLPIPTKTVVKEEEKTPGKIWNLLGSMILMPSGLVSGPTMMEEYLLTALYVPCYARVFLKEAPEAAPVATVTLRLRVGGDIVWEGSQQAASQLLVAKLYRVNVSFHESFINPIAVPHGRTLTAEVLVSFTANKPELSREVGISAEAGEAEGESGVKVENSEGRIDFDAKVLSGHRTL